MASGEHSSDRSNASDVSDEPDAEQRPENKQRLALVFRINDEKGSGPELVREVLLDRGWVEYDGNAEGIFDPHEDWNFWWRSSHFRGTDYLKIRSWQRLNHFPCAFEISRKDYLARNMKRMRFKYPESYNFVPESYHLPTEYVNFLTECNRGSSSAMANVNDREVNSSQSNVGWKPPNRFWICKPSDMSRGRGIHIFTDVCELQHSTNCIVQRYVHNPLLLFGYKFDCRIYVLVVSFKPLILYVYDEGIVRFATAKYDLSDLRNVYAHLTNTAINKQSYAYAQDKLGVGVGCKWSLTRLRHYLQQNNYNTDHLWSGIVEIIVLTILCQAVHASINVTNCFELYGFDILIDTDMKPWLLEVNFCPQLTNDCALDEQIKKPLISDLIDLLNFQESDKRDLTPRRSKRRNRPKTSVPKKTYGIQQSLNFRAPEKPRSALHRVPTATSLHRVQFYTGEGAEDMDYFESTHRLSAANGNAEKSHRLLKSQHAEASVWRSEKTVSSPERKVLLVTPTGGPAPILPSLGSDRISMNRAAILRIYGPRLLSQSARVRSASQTSLLFNPADEMTSVNNRSKQQAIASVRTRSGQSNRLSSPAVGQTADSGPATIMACYEMCQQAQRSTSKASNLYCSKLDQQTVEPPSRVGGFVLLFPFNSATRHAVEGLDDRLIVQQLKKCVSHEVRRQRSKQSPSKASNTGLKPSWVTENLWGLA